MYLYLRFRGKKAPDCKHWSGMHCDFCILSVTYSIRHRFSFTVQDSISLRHKASFGSSLAKMRVETFQLQHRYLTNGTHAFRFLKGIQVRSVAWCSRPTDHDWHRARTMERCECGTWRRANVIARWRVIYTRSPAWCSRPTDHDWHRARGIKRCECGTWRRANIIARWRVIHSRSPGWCSRPTDHDWHRARTIERCECGTWRRASINTRWRVIQAGSRA